MTGAAKQNRNSVHMKYPTCARPFLALARTAFLHPQLTQPMTEKVDIFRMGMVFKKYLANGGMHFLGHEGGASDFDTTEHKHYNLVSACSKCVVMFVAAGRYVARPRQKSLSNPCLMGFLLFL